jgi:hypothetical protein
MTHDTTLMRKNLRKETAAMLRLDINNLTPAQSVRLDRAATLRLELNDIEECKLNGAPFDTVKYIAASEALERMLGGDPERPSQQFDFTGAREELSRFLAGRAEALARKAERTAALEASKQNMVPAYDPAAKAELALTDGRAHEPAVAELMPEGEVLRSSHTSHSSSTSRRRCARTV